MLSLWRIFFGDAAFAATLPPTTPAPARGVLLVAHPDMRDPNFAQTVVLITDHGLQGSVGLVLNRGSDVPVVASIPALDGLEDADINLRYGGPLALNSIRLLVGSGKPIDTAEELLDGVYFVNSTSLLRRLLTETRARGGLMIHYYAGFAAWSPGQLDAEIARGDWYLGAAESAIVFADDDVGIWQELVETLAGRWVLRENARVPANAVRPLIVNTVTNPGGFGRPGTATAYNREHIIMKAAYTQNADRRAAAATVDMDQKQN